MWSESVASSGRDFVTLDIPVPQIRKSNVMRPFGVSTAIAPSSRNTLSHPAPVLMEKLGKLTQRQSVSCGGGWLMPVIFA